jgi:tripartite-type tricarboxylate transporter receptor subunit TctC
MTRPEVLQRMAEIDTIPLYLPPAAFKADVAAYLAFWSGLVERIGLSVEG